MTTTSTPAPTTTAQADILTAQGFLRPSTVAGLGVTFILICLTPAMVQRTGVIAALVAVVAAAAGVVAMATRGLGRHRLSTWVADAPGFLLYLSPVLLLSSVFPLVSSRMAAASVNGVSLSAVVLACSVTVPWLAQSGCLPAYRVLGPLMQRRDPHELTRAFTSHWASLFAGALPVTVVATVLVAVVTGWNLSAVGTYFMLLVAHLLFIQSLILSNVLSRKGLWAAGWSAYAAALVIAPTVWWLPPVAGTVIQLIPMRHHLDALGELKRIEGRALLADLVRGFLLGSVLWADKFVLYMLLRDQFPVIVMFTAMLPSVIAYNYYFVRYAPTLDSSIAGLHASIAQDSMTATAIRARATARLALDAVSRSMAGGLLLTLATTALLSLWQPHHAGLAALAGVASWVFMSLTLVSYKLDYVGEKVTAQIVGAIHLTTVVLAALTGSLTLVLTTAVAVDAVLLSYVWLTYRAAWENLPFTLFWRHAIGW